jgi:hypothetical protein
MRKQNLSKISCWHAWVETRNQHAASRACARPPIQNSWIILRICLPCDSDLLLVLFSFEGFFARRTQLLLGDGWKAAPTSGQCVHAVLIVAGLQATAWRRCLSYCGHWPCYVTPSQIRLVCLAHSCNVGLEWVCVVGTRWVRAIL